MSPRRARSSRLFRTAPALIGLALAGSLVACSSDKLPPSSDPDAKTPEEIQSLLADNGTGPSDGSSGSASSSPGPVPGVNVTGTRQCTVTVEVTGDVEAQFDGTGEDRIPPKGDGPRAVYTAKDGDVMVTLYMAGKNFAAQAKVASGETVYISDPGSDEGLTFGALRRGAVADVDLTDGGSGTVHLTTRFICEKELT